MDTQPLYINGRHVVFDDFFEVRDPATGEVIARVSSVGREVTAQAIEHAARLLDLTHLHLPSGAAHDAQIMASVAPAGMIFLPSKEGRSHSPAEWTAWSDIEMGTNVLIHTLLRLAA
jgi:acetylornithine deacetylase/succinyl-diaminopimelate desuccinylase-like protein